MRFVSVDPFTGKKIRSYAAHKPKEIDVALTRAQRAAVEWRHVSVTARARQIRAVSKTLRNERDALSFLISAEMGKPITQARGEIEKCADCCDYYARNAKGFLQPESPVEAPKGASVEFEPLGVILAIMPWNFPFWQAFRAAIPALIAGNAMVLKHASNVSGCALAIEAVFKRSGLPKYLFQTLLISSDQIPSLIEDRRIQGITLTGSTAAGKQVAALAGRALKSCVFELGGSDAYLVLADANLDQAAETCAEARLVNAGQSCVAAKRFIGDRRVLPAFEEKFAERMQVRRAGDPRDPATEIGPLARSDLRDELHDQVQRSIRAGARCLIGGTVPKGEGFFYPATVLTRVKPGSPAYQEELFGPVASVIAARDEDDAIKIANDSVYGLGGAVFTRSPARGQRVARAIQAGMVFINSGVRSHVALPFGGVKESGYGRELAAWGARAFVNVKTLWTA